MAPNQVECPICNKQVAVDDINRHLDTSCPGSSSSPSKLAITSGATLLEASSQGTEPSSSSISKNEQTPISTPRIPAASSTKSTFFSQNSGKRKSRTPELTDTRQARIQPSDTPNGAERQTSIEKKARPNPLTANQPLAERSRPTTLDLYIGQDDLVGTGSLLRARIQSGEGVGSCILWGPPGCGKTTLARLIARTADADFKELSATSAGAADVRLVFEQAKNTLKLTGRRTILMVDEIHRFTKPQQDLFLPYVENGWVQLIGATTENPSFKVNGALLSRCQVFTLLPHTTQSLETILTNALNNLSTPIPHLPPDLVPFLAEIADGDARQALNGLELALKVCQTATHQTTLPKIEVISSDTNGLKIESMEETKVENRLKRDQDLMEAIRRGLRKGYDRSGEERYDMISALHKCLRGSDGSAAMYWLARMITGGEDPLYIARRLVVVASEDVGLADSQALPLAIATYQACQVIGLPECRINLAHLVAYLAEAPKSTRSYTAYKRAAALAQTPPLPGVPLQIRNAPTTLMKKLGYGKHYSYNPDYAHPVYNEYLPEGLARHSSWSDTPDQHILRTDEVEKSDKTWDEERLSEWEARVNGGERWEWRRSDLDEMQEEED